MADHLTPSLKKAVASILLTPWMSACLLLSAYLIGAWFVIGAMLHNESGKILYSLHLRADSIAASLEGAARFIGKQKFDLSSLLREIGRQPGIAWLALVRPDGRILLDSNQELSGTYLYSAHEMEFLDPDSRLQGRFSPDDPDIYETWKIFSPARLSTRGHHNLPFYEGSIIFVALNAAFFRSALAGYRFQLWLIASLIAVAGLTLACIAFYLPRYLGQERILKKTEAIARQVMENHPGALVVTSPAGLVTFKNRNTARLFPEDAGKPDIRVWNGMDWQGLMQRAAGGKPVFERKNIRTGQKRLPVHISANTVRDASGSCTGFLFIVTDLTESERLRRKLAQAKRLSEIGRLASGLAHEIRNPLSSICGYACYLENKLASDPLSQATARLLVDESSRLNTVLTELLSLAREPVLKPQAVPIAGLLEKLVLLVAPDAENRRITLQLPSDKSLTLFADQEKLLQALLNLLINAIQATPADASIEISARLLPPASQRLPADLSQDCDYWLVEIADNGPGMSEEILAQIFTPYFTTRPAGTGLGLAIARQIIETHGGLVQVRSAPGQGAVFSVFIPQRDTCGKET